MYTEITFNEYSLTDLLTLMALKLREFEELEQQSGELKERISKREELELIQKVIDEKRGLKKP